LHASLGFPGERAHADVLPVMENAIKRIVKTGKFAGILTDETLAKRWIDAGAAFVGIGSDVGILARGAEAMAAKFKF
jgi:4-hydroxy-2-oxoheptanedioate aldolase